MGIRVLNTYFFCIVVGGGVVVVVLTVFIAFVRFFVNFSSSFFLSQICSRRRMLMLLRLYVFSFSLMFIRKYNYLDNTVDLDYTEIFHRYYCCIYC